MDVLGSLFNKYVESSSQILNTHWNIKPHFSKKQIFVDATANISEIDEYKVVGNLNRLFFQFDCFSNGFKPFELLYRKAFLTNPSFVLFFLVVLII